MVLPLIFLALLSLLMLSMCTYQHVMLYKDASIAAERTAFRWDNSYRDALSGMGATGQYDGLYWRMSDNGALQSLFGGESSEERISVNIGSSVQPSSNSEGDAAHSLPERKLIHGAGYVPEPLAGEISVSGMLEKEIEVKLRHPMSIPLLDLLMGCSEPRTVSSVVVVDPVELIRNVDLVRYYAGRFNGKEKEQAKQILSERSR
ncbi:hypothetical protein A8990_14422 [Paenibacillus taihuensis]|uniref:TadE-like protein n=1 Tax=Paenibacillus taihuensis TaxID=1156355 RepID=A0A3D9QVL5_9BACL|nr:hypothetical protein [Paenibacillus taihuensis]REE67266.1 hypothetical protein A8990_14422 [Paenibacillus taihuensis]